MRLFVSIDLPEALASEIADIQDALAPADGLRMTDPRQAHVTVKFLGDVDPDRVDAVGASLESAVEDAEIAPFTARVEGLGVFPDLEYIRVVWAGVGEGDAEMTALAEAVEAHLVEAGFDPADHPFTPHVTLARMEHAGGKSLVQRVVRDRSPRVGRFTVEAIHLTESTLTPEGPVYETVDRVPLVGA